MKKKLRYCIGIYVCIFMMYLSICILSYFDNHNISVKWPKISIQLIKEYPNFEGANIIK
jgi:hypothetical protein